MRTIHISFDIQIPDDLDYMEEELDKYLKFNFGLSEMCKNDIYDRLSTVDACPVAGTFEWAG